MLNVARPETRIRERADQPRLSWGIVDFILGAVMLPFGIWMFVIDRMVAAVAWLLSLGSPRPPLGNR